VFREVGSARMSDPQVKKALKDLALPPKPSATKACIVLADKVVWPSPLEDSVHVFRDTLPLAACFERQRRLGACSHYCCCTQFVFIDGRRQARQAAESRKNFHRCGKLRMRK